LENLVELCDDNYDALEDSDGLIIVTEWLQYREPDYEKMLSLMNTAVIFDGRNIYKPEVIKKQGFKYYGIGRS